MRLFSLTCLIRIERFGIYIEYHLGVCHERETALMIKFEARDRLNYKMDDRLSLKMKTRDLLTRDYFRMCV